MLVIARAKTQTDKGERCVRQQRESRRISGRVSNMADDGAAEVAEQIKTQIFDDY